MTYVESVGFSSCSNSGKTWDRVLYSLAFGGEEKRELMDSFFSKIQRRTSELTSSSVFMAKGLIIRSLRVLRDR